MANFIGMGIKTASELQKLVADRVKTESAKAVAKSLNIAEIYAMQIATGARPVSKTVAARMGYRLADRQPKVDKIFVPIDS
jgi:hypothetical protein